MKKIMVYSEANRVLGSSLTPANRCLSKSVALGAGADPSPLTLFTNNRLVEASIVKRHGYGPDLPDDMPDYSGNPKEYFTTKAETSGTISFNIPNDVYGYDITVRTISWSKDGGQTWHTTTVDRHNQDVTITVDVSAGEEVCWKGDVDSFAENYRDHAHCYFSSTCKFSIKNNLLSLLYDIDAEGLTPEQLTRLDGRKFTNLFKGCTGLTSAKDLYFPSYITTGSHHFGTMFWGCTNLVDASFVASSGQLSDSCFERMFLGCKKLKYPPVLPSTQLNGWCYSYMFSGCTALEVGPYLPARELWTCCYGNMFGPYKKPGDNIFGNHDGCTSLKEIRMAARTTDSREHWEWNGTIVHPLNGWVQEVPPSGGTFYGDASWGRGNADNEYEGIPQNWTIVNQ